MTPTIVDPKYCKPPPSSLETSSVPILASHSPKFSKSILQIACDVGCHLCPTHFKTKYENQFKPSMNETIMPI